MPNRIIREGILTSDAVNKLKWPAEVFYRRLMSKVDDFGRFDGRVEILRGEMYALKPNVSNADVASWLRECESVGLVSRYAAEDKQCVVIHKFDQQVRAKKSKWPPPPDNLHSTCAQTRADAHLDGVGDEVGDDKNTSPRGDGLPGFDAWWEQYPRKVGKKAARRAYKTALRDASPEVLMAGLLAYRKHKPPDVAWCHPTTWLNAGRWEDEHGPVKSKPKTGIALLSEADQADLAEFAKRAEQLDGYPVGAEPVRQAMRKHLEAWRNQR
jgi:hypothetical protein